MTKSDYASITDFIKSQFPNRDFIPLHEPKFIGNEKMYVSDAIDSTFVSSVGAFVNKFEEMLADVVGVNYAVATVNGTAALHLALVVAGVKPNDLVITQALTFVATCNAIRYTDATPVFVDVDLATMGMSPQSLENWLYINTYQQTDSETNQVAPFHKKTKQRIAAVVPMHTFGHPCYIDQIEEICAKYNITLVEDAAESIGSYFNGKHTGSFGKLSVFSFNGNKTLTSGGGGAIVTNNEKHAKMAKHLSTQAKQMHPWEFNHDFTGYNYRMPNINAALACAQLEQLNFFILNKRELAQTYNNFFANFQSIEFFKEQPSCKSNYWLNSIRFGSLEERNEFLKFSNENGVMTRPIWTLMNKLPMFSQAEHSDLTNSIYLAERIVNIPSSVRC